MKKKFLFIIVSILLTLSNFSIILANSPQYTKRELKPLRYDYNALEPYIDEETMILHYNRHYKSYLDKFNSAISKYPDLYSSNLTDLLACLDCLPTDIAKTIKNSGGGVYNHEFFFDIMTPNETKLSGELKNAINKYFGSFEDFKKSFIESSLGIFGSGWAWLVSNDCGELSIITTSNQDTPITLNLKPIIGIDVWEHAYYLTYKNKRSDYISNWFNVIDWNKANENYKNTIK